MRRVPAARLLPFLALLALAGPARAAGEARPQVHLDLDVALDPGASAIRATGTLAFPGGLDGLERSPKGGLKVVMHAGLALESADPAFVVEPLGEEKDPGGGESGPEALKLRAYDLRPAAGALDAKAAIRLAWRGKIHHPPVAEAEEYARSFARTPGTIGPEGAVLTRATWWVPTVGERLLSFRLAASLPPGWDAVSQGKRVERQADAQGTRVVWDCPHPMDEVYLIASKFALYERKASGFDAMAYLRTPDPALAGRYLEATAQYVDMYRGLIGPYPFEKFALVENFWETGYGMPSFTLLGPTVIRLPFILHSSYPHEILHNWWGNSVYVDWETGNWCEGLTAYMADHLIREGQGRGAEYRFDTLKKYRSYAAGGRDFPLREFRSRHSGATEAVGYGKSLFLFHMLRRDLGDDAFRAALQRFYRENLWRSASFADLERVFSEAAGRDLKPFFAQWLDRSGAPELTLSARGIPGGLRIAVRQVQKAGPYKVRVPVAITMKGRPDAVVVPLDLEDVETVHDVNVAGQVLRVDLDPEFDVFRRLDVAEVPPTLGELFGAEKVTIVLPAAGKDAMAAAWAKVAEGWKGGGSDVVVVEEDALKELPADRAVWVLGSRNAWAKALSSDLAVQHAGPGETYVEFGETRVPLAGHAFAFVVRHPRSDDLPLGWIGADLPAALPGLAKKLPHYGKYSWLGFAGEEPTNVAKGQWAPRGTPLVWVPGMKPDEAPPPRGSLPPRPPLARLAPAFDAERLMGHVRFLADDRLEGRGAGSKGLDEAVEYVARAFKEAGLEPGGDGGTYFQSFEAEGGPDGKPVRLRNVVGVLPGTNPAWKAQSVVLGAHADHLGRGWPDVREGAAGQVHNGADDNASGVAVLLEMARSMAPEPRPRSVVFVAFSGEEWGLKGSRHYVRAMQRFPAKDALAMVNLDTVGRLGERKLLVMGTGSAREWPFIVMGVAATTGVDATAVPDDQGGSDQVAFREAGVPAVQVFSGPHADYHRPSDKADRVDAAGLAKVAAFVRETMDYLASRPEPLSPAGAPPSAGTSGPGAGGPRRAALGTMPDFAFEGPGVKVQSVAEGSPAAKAGIAAGDVITSIGGKPVENLKAYSALLKERAPGDVVKVVWRRGEQEMSADVTLAAR